MSLSAKLLVEKLTKVYSLPTIYMRLDKAIHDPLSDMEDIALILSEDSALSARLLRLANSAMYNFPSKIDTITRAISIIGTKQLRDLVLATTVINLFQDIPASVVNMNSFWRHNIAVGLAARIIATYQRESNVERFYLMGLLHDIGRLVMYIQIPKIMTEVIEQSRQQPQLLYRAEREKLGFNHADVGQCLAKVWQLPAVIEQSIGNHHRPTRSASFVNEAAVIHCADVLINGMQLGSSGEIYVPELSEQAWQTMKISAGQLPDIMQHIDDQFEDVAAIFLA